MIMKYYYQNREEQNVETTIHLQPNSNMIDLITSHQISPQRMQPDRVRYFLRQGLLSVILCIASALPVMAAPIQLPAIVEPASQEHHVGKLIFVELVTPDLAVAKKFYAGLFGWTFRDIQAGGTAYAEAFLGRRTDPQGCPGERASEAGMAQLFRSGRCRRGKKGCLAKCREGAVRAAYHS